MNFINYLICELLLLPYRLSTLLLYVIVFYGLFILGLFPFIVSSEGNLPSPDLFMIYSFSIMFFFIFINSFVFMKNKLKNSILIQDVSYPLSFELKAMALFLSDLIPSFLLFFSLLFGLKKGINITHHFVKQNILLIGIVPISLFGNMIPLLKYNLRTMNLTSKAKNMIVAIPFMMSIVHGYYLKTVCISTVASKVGFLDFLGSILVVFFSYKMFFWQLKIYYSKI